MSSNSVVQTGGQEGGRERRGFVNQEVRVYGASENIDEDSLGEGHRGSTEPGVP